MKNRENITLPSTIVTFEKFKNEMVKIEYIDIHSGYGHHPFPLLARKADHNELNSLCHLKLRDVLNRIKNYVADDYDDILVSMDFPANNEIKSDFVVAIQISNRVLKNLCVIEYDSDTGSKTKESNGEEYEFTKCFRDTIKEFCEILI